MRIYSTPINKLILSIIIKYKYKNNTILSFQHYPIRQKNKFLRLKNLFFGYKIC